MITDHKIFIETLVSHEQTTIKISLQYMASIISKENDKTSSLYVPSDTKQLVQQKLATNIHHILIPLQISTLKDSEQLDLLIYEFSTNFY